MKSSTLFSYHYPLIVAEIIFFNTFFLLHFNALGNQEISTDWRTVMIFAYSFLSGATYYLYHCLFRNVVNTQNWTVRKDIFIFLQLVVIAACLMLTFTKFYSTFINSKYNTSYLTDGRFILFFGLISLINFSTIKFLDLTFYYKKKSQLTPNSAEFNTKQTPVSLTIQGKNQHEFLTLPESDFILAEASGNYVMIYYEINGVLKKDLLRTSLGDILNQTALFPQIVKIHRSYIINKNNILKVTKGNRKVALHLRLIDFEVQVSKSNISVLELENKPQ